MKADPTLIEHIASLGAWAKAGEDSRALLVIAVDYAADPENVQIHGIVGGTDSTLAPAIAFATNHIPDLARNLGRAARIAMSPVGVERWTRAVARAACGEPGAAEHLASLESTIE